MAGGEDLTGAAARARDWHHSLHTAVCDVIEPWEYGTVVRASRYTDYFDYNAVRVEREPEMSLGEIVAFADDALSGLAHRRVDFDLIRSAERLRAGFRALGWRTMRLLWMRHAAPLEVGDRASIPEVPYDTVHELRVEWHREDFPGADAGAYHAQSRELDLSRGAQVLAVLEGTVPVAFAQVVRQGATAEVTHVYVRPDRRGAGLGTSLTRAAIATAHDAKDLWICADDEDRPKELYARLGFQPAWTSMEFLRMPR